MIYIKYSRLIIIFILVGTLLTLNSCGENSSNPDQNSYHGVGIDTVYKFTPGEGQSFGQDPEFFPKNIYGLPDKNSRFNLGSANPYEILSLGLGGEIIIGFKNKIILNGEGPDFCVFENAFLNIITDKIFIEPAQILVSSDGIEYTAFPYSEDTFTGCAGISPVNGDENSLNPNKSGGDLFDLETIGMDSIRYIKIIDISRTLLENPEHPLYDPTITGFDLDAVIAYYFTNI